MGIWYPSRPLRLAGVFVLAVAGVAAVHGIVVANMNCAVQPGNDFFTHANGGWLKRTTIPAGRTGVSSATGGGSAAVVRHSDLEHLRIF